MARSSKHRRRQLQQWRETSDDSRAIRWREFRDERESREAEEERRYADELNKIAEARRREEEQARIDAIHKQQQDEADKKRQYIEELNRRAVKEQRKQKREQKRKEQEWWKEQARQQKITDDLNKKYVSSSQRTGTVTGYVLTSDGSSNTTVSPQKFDTSFSKLRQGLSSAVTEEDFFGTTAKRNLPDGGIQQTVLIRDDPNNAETLRRATGDISSQLVFANKLPATAEPFQQFKGVTYAGEEAFFGKKAKKTFEKLIKAQMGGKVDWEGDTAHYEYALGEDFVKEQEKKGLNPAGVFETNAFAKAREQSDKYASEHEEVKNDRKEEKTSRRKTFGSVLKVIALLTAITTIARRILSAIFTGAVKAREDTVLAHNLGTSYQVLQHYSYLEKAHGLKGGTFAGALQDIQEKFGNLTNLDEKALGELARVMGTEIQDIVLSGAGGKEPDKLMEKILDKYFMSYKAGKNSIGQYVGQEQARRELVSALNKVSPALAGILATMIEANQSGVFKDKISNFSDFKSTVAPHRRLITDIDASAYQVFGQTVTRAGEEFKKLIDDASIALTQPLGRLVNKILHSRIGMSDLERDRMNKKEMKEAKETVTALRERKASALGSLREAVRTTEGIKWEEWETFDFEELLSSAPSAKAQKLVNFITTSSDARLLPLLTSAKFSKRESEKIQKDLDAYKPGKDFYFVIEDYLDEAVELAIQEEMKKSLGVDSGKLAKRKTSISSQFSTFAYGASPDEWLAHLYEDTAMWVDFETMRKEAPDIYAGFNRAYSDIVQDEMVGGIFTKEGVNKRNKYEKSVVNFASKYFYGKSGIALTDEKVKDIIARKERADEAVAYFQKTGNYEQMAKTKASYASAYNDYDRLMEAQRQAFAFAMIVQNSPLTYSSLGKDITSKMSLPYLENFEGGYALNTRIATEITVEKIIERLINSKQYTAKQLAGVSSFDYRATQDTKNPQHYTFDLTFVDSNNRKQTGKLDFNLSAGGSVNVTSSGTLKVLNASMQANNSASSR